MATLSPEVVMRIAKLMPLLSSDKAGEVTGTAAAIGRILTAVGADWHDLVDTIGASGPAIVYLDALGRKTKPPIDAPPLFEALKRSAKLDWLGHAVASDLLDEATRALCIAIRAQVYSQPHKTVPPRHCTAISVALGTLWAAGTRA